MPARVDAVRMVVERFAVDEQVSHRFLSRLTSKLSHRNAADRVTCVNISLQSLQTARLEETLDSGLKCVKHCSNNDFFSWYAWSRMPGVVCLESFIGVMICPRYHETLHLLAIQSSLKQHEQRVAREQ